MKKIIYLIGLTLFSIANAQIIRVQYEERANIENQIKNVKDPEIRKQVSAHLSKPAYFTLFYENGESLYIQNNVPFTIKGIDKNEIDNARKAFISQHSGGLYKNYNTNEYISEADIFGKRYLIKDNLQKHKWEFTNEVKVINQYQVKKANAVINGEKVIAWYTEEFSLKDGPYDYYGLPGLALEINTFDKDYVAVNIEKFEESFEIKKPSKGQLISKINYERLLKETIDNLKQMGDISLN